MIGDIAILVLMFLAGWLAGKQHDTLGSFKDSVVRKVKGWVGDKPTTPP